MDTAASRALPASPWVHRCPLRDLLDPQLVYASDGAPTAPTLYSRSTSCADLRSIPGGCFLSTACHGRAPPVRPGGSPWGETEMR